jgi:hypothetical protein
MSTEKLCKVTGCSKVAVSHGLCRTHYKMLLKKKNNGETTWQELEARGISEPAKFTKDKRDRELLEAFLAEKFGPTA